MTKTIQTSLSDSDLQTFAEGTTKEQADAVQALFESLEESEIGELLGYFCDGDREAYNEDPTVMHVTMEDEDTGMINVDFTGSAYYGCKDMDRLDKHSELVVFKISLQASLITFTTEPPDPPDRPPDEEF